MTVKRVLLTVMTLLTVFLMLDSCVNLHIHMYIPGRDNRDVFKTNYTVVLIVYFLLSIIYYLLLLLLLLFTWA
jgi:uncharacterized membrane protein YozB (DUF420 family)